jgi:hypothetical protein
VSIACFFQQSSPQIIEKLQLHPSVVDLFLGAATLKDHADNYWKGIEELQKEWDLEDENIGEQERITREIYDQIKTDLPDIVKAGSVEVCWIGGDDYFDWLENEGITITEIGNFTEYGYTTFFSSEQVLKITRKLEQFKKLDFTEVHKIIYPRSDVPENNKQEEKDFWEHFDKILFYCQQCVSNGDGLITRMLE